MKYFGNLREFLAFESREDKDGRGNAEKAGDKALKKYPDQSIRIEETGQDIESRVGNGAHNASRAQAFEQRSFNPFGEAGEFPFERDPENSHIQDCAERKAERQHEHHACRQVFDFHKAGDKEMESLRTVEKIDQAVSAHAQDGRRQEIDIERLLGKSGGIKSSHKQENKRLEKRRDDEKSHGRGGQPGSRPVEKTAAQQDSHYLGPQNHEKRRQRQRPEDDEAGARGHLGDKSRDVFFLELPGQGRKSGQRIRDADERE